MNQINRYFINIIRRDYWKFNGKIAREPYWMFMLIFFVGSLCVALIAGFLGLYFLNAMYTLFLMIPVIGMTVRRLRDVGFSAWWILLGLFPVLGEMIVLLMCVFPGGYKRQLKKIIKH